MYESPIEKVVGEIQSQIIKQDDENIMYAVKQAVGYSVDKNELIKALKYDREQYEKGYRDGLNADKWIPVSERLPEDRREVLVTAYWHETYQVMMASYYGDGLWWCVPFNNCGEHMQRLNPKAWMPLPTPYEPRERSGEE